MICLSLYGTNEEICDAITASLDADLFEVRLDLSPELNAARIRSATTKPLIFTAHGKPDLLNAVEPFADYIDVEQGPLRGKNPIVSVHTEDGNPADLWQKHPGSGITKIVLETQDYATIHPLLQLNRKHHPRALCFAAGEVGAFSRILSLFWGAPWLYASLPGRSTGAGQFALQELIDVYRVPRYRDSVDVFGIVGDPVAHSRSPMFHNQKFAAAGLPWTYLPFPCKNLKSLLDHAPAFGIRGFSITHPYKEEVLPLLQHKSDDVLHLRSCNTVCRKGNAWYGINTDVAGIAHLIEQVSLADARVAILGAGGSARAIASVVRPLVRDLTILNRTKTKADALSSEYQARSGTLDDFVSCQYDVLFQATPVGLHEGECPIDPTHLRPGTTVIDAIYEPSKTLLLQKAEALGCRAINGEAWFVSQAEAQFQWWTSMIEI